MQRPLMATRQDWARVADVPLEERMNLTCTYDVLANATSAAPDKPALSFQLKGEEKSKGFSWTYREYLEEVHRAANLFHSLGADKSNPVALLLPNLPETAFAKFAAEAAGIVNPINPLLEPGKIAGILREAGAKILVTLAPFPKTDIAQRAAEAVTEAPNVETIIEIDMLRYVGAPLSWIIPLIRPKVKAEHSAQVLDYHRETRKHPADKLTFEVSRDPDAIGALFHTGGTTGDPKLAQHTQHNMVFTSWMVRFTVFESDDVILCALPLFHVLGAYVMCLGPAYAHAHVILVSPAGFRGDGVMQNFWKIIERWRATFFVGVPTAIAALDQVPINADVSSLKMMICGSAPLPVELFNRFERNTGIRILEGFGQTECTCIASCNPPEGKSKIGSVGFPGPYTQMKVGEFDSDGNFVRDCGIDEIGEILIKGPNVFPGYVDAHKNEKLFVDGFVRSGDLGREDADGYFWITGRAKDLIIRGGHNIDPAAIEDMLIAHPAVAFVGAIGQPDSYAGELPCAYVELNEGAKVTTEELMHYATGHIQEQAAKPVYIEIVDELPKTAVGKIFKPDLRRSAIARVYDKALAEAGITASVDVIDDKVLGMVAEVTSAGDNAEAACAKVLNEFPIKWRMAG